MGANMVRAVARGPRSRLQDGVSSAALRQFRLSSLERLRHRGSRQIGSLGRAASEQAVGRAADQPRCLEGIEPAFHRPPAPARVEHHRIAYDVVEMLDRWLMAGMMLVAGDRAADEE